MNIKTVKHKILGMHCTSCALSIDWELEDAEGVIETKTNYAKSETEIKFDEDKINSDQIKDIIKKLGYQTAE